MNINTAYVVFAEEWHKKGDILITSDGSKLKVIKVYRANWWKKILNKLGFNLKIKGVKIKLIN